MKIQQIIDALESASDIYEVTSATMTLARHVDTRLTALR